MPEQPTLLEKNTAVVWKRTRLCQRSLNKHPKGFREVLHKLEMLSYLEKVCQLPVCITDKGE